VDQGKAKARVLTETLKSGPADPPEHHDEATGHELVLHGARFHVEEDYEEEDVLEFDLDDKMNG
jgi:hypothetical protein